MGTNFCQQMMASKNWTMRKTASNVADDVYHHVILIHLDKRSKDVKNLSSWTVQGAA